MVCRWTQLQEGDWARPHLCKLAQHGSWPVRKRVHQRPCMTREIETWLSDSRVGNNSVVDHIRSRRPVLSPLRNCVVWPHWASRCKPWKWVLKDISVRCTVYAAGQQTVSSHCWCCVVSAEDGQRRSGRFPQTTCRWRHAGGRTTVILLLYCFSVSSSFKAIWWL